MRAEGGRPKPQERRRQPPKCCTIPTGGFARIAQAGSPLE
jgi:hypothetical protein